MEKYLSPSSIKLILSAGLIQAAFTVGLYTRFPSDVILFLGPSFLLNQTFDLVLIMSGNLLFLKLMALFLDWIRYSGPSGFPEFEKYADSFFLLALTFLGLVSFMGAIFVFLLSPFTFIFLFYFMLSLSTCTMLLIGSSSTILRVKRVKGLSVALYYLAFRRASQARFWISPSRLAVVVIFCILTSFLIGFQKTNSILNGKVVRVFSGENTFDASLVHVGNNYLVFFKEVGRSENFMFTGITIGEFNIVSMSVAEQVLISE